MPETFSNCSSPGEQKQRQTLEQCRTCFGESEQLWESIEILSSGYKSAAR